MTHKAEQTLLQKTDSKPDISFSRLIGTGMAGKLLVDIGNQIFSSFLPIIAAGLGVSVVMLGQWVGLRSAIGIFAPVGGAIADRYGYRPVSRVTLLANAAGFLLLAFSTAPWMIVVGMMLAGLGIGIFVPNLHAYVSGKLPYSLRARGLGMIEYAWALTGIVGLSLVGLLIATTSWRVPFVLLAIGMVVMSFVFGALPDVHREQATPAVTAAASRWHQAAAIFNLRTNRRSAYATILAGALSYFAAMQVMIAHSAWLAEQYALGAAELGFVAFVFGWFDLAASVSVSLFTDRIGKKRSVLIGIVGSLVGYTLMPALNTSILLAVASIAFARMFFEFNIVSHFPLLSEQVPAQRGQTLTLGSAAILVAGTAAGFSGPWLFVNFGVAALAWSSGAVVVVALAVVLLLVREEPA